jgi:hypothetical protein
MQDIWLQLITTGGAMVLGIFFTIRYAMNKTAEREKSLLEHTEKTQVSMLKYFETKNGHMERISSDFTKTSRDMSEAINRLSTEISILAVKHDK